MSPDPRGPAVAGCPVTAVLERVGDRWSVVVLRTLERPHGFNELDRAVPGISRRMLIRTLDALVAEGWVARRRFGSRAPSRVEYSLTERGGRLRDQLRRLAEWAAGDPPG